MKLCLLITVAAITSPQILSDHFFSQAASESPIIKDVFATAYYCVYNTEIAGSQTVIKTISDNTYTLKASFLYGGNGVAMQGTGKTAPDGSYIKYAGGAGPFIRLSGPDAGKNLAGQYIINPQTLRNRYARLGLTDFSGFGNLALLQPDHAVFAVVPFVAGSSGRRLAPWYSVAVDTALVPLGKSFVIRLGHREISLAAHDVGPLTKGKRIDIYLGEGQDALNQWLSSGGNRYVNIYLP